MALDLSLKSFQNVIYRLHDVIVKHLANRQLYDADSTCLRRELVAIYYKKKGLYHLYDKELRKMKDVIDAGPEYDLFRSWHLMNVAHMDYFSEKHYKIHKPHQIL